VLPEQVEQRRFDRGDGVDRRPQIEGLQAAAAGIAIGEAALHLLQDRGMGAESLADHKRPGVLQRLPDLLAARHLADAGAPALSSSTSRLRVKNGPWAPAQVEQHAVATGNRNDTHRDHARRG
jgi:hypothetical protein